MAYAEVNDCRLAYDLEGTTGPTLVLVHGLAAHRRTWRDQVPTFAHSYHVLTWDLRGHGDSEATDSAYTFEELAGDLAGLLDCLAVERCLLIGHSFGAMIALRCALDHPDRVMALVLAASASECDAKSAEMFEARARQVEAEGIGDLLPPGNRTHPWAYARGSRAAASLHAHPMTPQLVRVGCPTLLLVGDRDPMGVGGSVILHRGIPESRLVVTPERGHFLHREAPEWFNQTVLEFLREVASAEEEPGRARAAR